MSHFTEFNKQASLYAQYRPQYPKELYDYLGSLSPSRDVAYDVGTGNGQCAIDLSRLFKKVYASDYSREQIANAIKNDKIHYFVSAAHESSLVSESVDLVTVATAVHWFDFDPFYNEMKRVLKPKGVIAVWAYGWHQCENSKVTEIFKRIGQGILLPYWSEPPKLIWDGYKRLPFPFPELSTPRFEVVTEWNLLEFVGYLSTWSSTQKFVDKNGYHPARDVFEELERAWGDQNKKLKFTAVLHLKVGQK